MYFVKGFKVFRILIAIPGLINLDFADVKTIMSNKGSALMGIGMSTGENRAAEAAKKAISSPLLETSIDGAKGVIMNITGGSNLSLFEVQEAADIVASASDEDVNMIFGSVINDNLKDEIIVTVIATGFTEEQLSPSRPARSAGFGASRHTDARTVHHRPNNVRQHVNAEKRRHSTNSKNRLLQRVNNRRTSRKTHWISRRSYAIVAGNNNVLQLSGKCICIFRKAFFDRYRYWISI